MSRAVRVEEDVHGVRLCDEDWRQEVPRTRWIIIGVAAAPVHQGCPVLFYDFDIVAWAGGRVTRTRINYKTGELQPQRLPTLYLYPLCPLKVARITFGVVWRGDDTCGKQSFKLKSTEGTFSTIVSRLLTLAATPVWRAN